MQNISRIKIYAGLIAIIIAIIFYNQLLTILSLMKSIALVLVGSLLSGSIRSSTFTQYIYILALLFFGPIYGFIGAYQGINGQTSRIVRAMAFLFCILAAYLGWLIGGMLALGTYPHYPDESPGELVALLYTIPGFVTGIFAIVITRLIIRLRTSYSIAVYGIMIPFLFILNLVLFFIASFPRQD